MKQRKWFLQFWQVSAVCQQYYQEWGGFIILIIQLVTFQFFVQQTGGEKAQPYDQKDKNLETN